MVAIVDPKVSKPTVLELAGSDDVKLCTSIVFDGSAMWVGLDTMPATLVRIDVDTLKYKVYPLESLSSCCRGLIAAGGAIWAGLYTAPAQVVRFDPEEESFQVVTLPDAYFNTRDLACDGKNIWIGLQNVRYGPSALYRLPMEESRTAGTASRKVIASLQTASKVPRIEHNENEIGITSQDWYRVRRGEDQIAWGEVKPLDNLPKIVLSRRAANELAFLPGQERDAVARQFVRLSAEPRGPTSKPIKQGGRRRLSPVGRLRIIYQASDQEGKILVSTIRKEIGVSFDPENMGPPPKR